MLALAPIVAALLACGSFDGAAPSAPDAATDGAGVVDGGSSDARPGGGGVPRTCRAIRDTMPGAPSGTYTIAPDLTLQPFEVFCDMTRDEGGWTLLITLAKEARTLENMGATNPFARVDTWPSTFARAGDEPTTTGMYKGSLEAFADVREEIAITIGDPGRIVYGRGKSRDDLDRIRRLHAWADRGDIPIKMVPSCSETYAVDASAEIPSCTSAANLLAGDNPRSILGWQWDIRVKSCWFARGSCAGCTNVKTGSSQCTATKEPDGAHWARTWFR